MNPGHISYVLFANQGNVESTPVRLIGNDPWLKLVEVTHRVEEIPLDFSDPEELRRSMEGADVLYNTYWIRYARGRMTFERAVEHGETVAITRHGKAVAHLVPADTQDRASRERAIERFRERRAGWRRAAYSTDEILAARHEGHRL